MTNLFLGTDMPSRENTGMRLANLGLMFKAQSSGTSGIQICKDQSACSKQPSFKTLQL